MAFFDELKGTTLGMGATPKVPERLAMHGVDAANSSASRKKPKRVAEGINKDYLDRMDIDALSKLMGTKSGSPEELKFRKKLVDSDRKREQLGIGRDDY